MADNEISYKIAALMKKIKPYLFIFFTLVLIIILIYFLQATSESMPGMEIPLKSMNREIRLSMDQSSNTFRIGDSFDVRLKNVTNVPIRFSEKGILVFKKDKFDWIPVEILSQTPNRDFQVSTKEKGYLSNAVIGVYPQLISDKPIDVRFVIIGHKLIDGNIIGQSVGGFIDFVMYP